MTADYGRFRGDRMPDAHPRSQGSGSPEPGQVAEGKAANTNEKGRAPTLRDPCAVCTVKRLSLCDALDEDGRARFRPMVHGDRLAPRETLFREGEPADYVYTVTSGQLSLSRSLPDGRRQIVDFVGPGDFVGLGLSLEKPGNHTLTAEALTETHVCRIGRNGFRKLMETEPALSHRALEFAARRISRAQEQQLSLGRKTAAERVAGFLVMLSDRAVARGASATNLSLPMTRAEIADHLGLTLETVSRAFSRLKQLGLIVPDGADRLLIADLPKLAQQAGNT